VPPEEFAEYAHVAKELGFRAVASGPFVRSSYHAAELFEPVAAEES
jgi:lipoic acid synthetase